VPDPEALFGEIDAGLAAGASDWHFRAGEPVWLRIGGRMRALERPACPADRLQALIAAALGAAGPVAPGTDGHFSRGGEHFRLHTYTAGGVPCLNLRHIPGRIPSLASLGLPRAFAESALAARRGLILVTGAIGSGKSTTLAAAIDRLNAEREELILTFEDPVEFRHAPRRSLVRQLQKGRDFEDFAEALHGALRSDPRILLVGEMRDTETISAALTAAETGLLVLGTLHCGSAPEAISRIVGAHPPDRAAEIRSRLAQSLVAVLAQQLVRGAGGRRLAAFELMLATPGVRHLIEDPQPRQHLLANEIATGARHGMISMEQSLEDLRRRRLVEGARP
jgi:twitching motility protein PilT